MHSEGRNKGQWSSTLQKSLRTLQIYNALKSKLRRALPCLFLTNHICFQGEPFKIPLEPYKMPSLFRVILFVLQYSFIGTIRIIFFSNSCHESDFK